MNGTVNDSTLAMKAAQDQEMVRRKMEIDALRKQLTPAPDKEAKLREACQGFETVFIQKLWEQMRNNVPKEGYLHSKQEAMYQSMYDHEFSKKMAEAGGIGLGDMLYEQLSQSLGASSRTSSPRVNGRLPVIPADSSPSGLKYSASPETAARIKPLYEDLDETDLEAPGRFSLDQGRTGREPLPLNPGSRFAPQLDETPGTDSENPSAGRAAGIETAAAAALGTGQGTVPETGPGAGGELDFEALSQDLLREELSGGLASGERQTPTSEQAREQAQAPYRPMPRLLTGATFWGVRPSGWTGWAG